MKDRLMSSMTKSTPLIITILLVLLSILTAATSATTIPGPTKVTIDSGIIQGRVNSDHSAREWRGIPYASPPLSQLRFASPVPPKPWGTNLLNTLTDGPGCPQTCILPPHTCPPVTSEDCLYLNVFSPLPSPSAPSKKYPVMVFIHGGDYYEGYGGGALYDGRTIANTSDTVLVSMNYRLGILGFMSSTPLNLTGNWAIEDQAAVLKWVQRNIHAFDGDPTQVTLFGQSAGAISTAIHMYSPLSVGLFHRAIIISIPMSLHFRSAADWTDVTTAIARTVNCRNGDDDLQCLRSVSSEVMIAAQDKLRKDILLDYRGLLQLFLPWTPTVGSTAVPMTPMEAFRTGAVRDIPFIIGDTRDEATLFIYQAFAKPVGVLEYDVFADLIFGLKAGGEVVHAYPPNTGAKDIRPAMSSAGTDALFLCANRNATLSLMTAAAANKTSSDVYVYLFDHVAADGAAWGNSTYCAKGVVCHGADVPFTFHATQLFQWTPAESVLSLRMIEYYTSFAHTGVPKGVIPWPAYDSMEKQSIRFQTGTTLQIDRGYDNQNCTWWDEQIGYVWP